MDLELFKTFIHLAESKNFTKTAERVNKTQSAVSLQIRRLEALVQKPLFSRDNRNVFLTPEGERLMSYAQQFVTLQEELLSSFKEPSMEGEITLGTPEDIATKYLPTILANFSQAYPKILLNVDCELSVNLLSKFEKEQVDIVLIKQDPHHPHPQAEVIWEESLVWAISENKSASEFLKMHANGVPIIVSPAPCVYRKRALDFLNAQGIRWRIVYTSPSLAGVIAAARAGLGLCVLPVNLIPRGLKMVKDPLLPLLHETQIALLRKKVGRPAIDALATYIIEHIRPVSS